MPNNCQRFLLDLALFGDNTEKQMGQVQGSTKGINKQAIEKSKQQWKDSMKLKKCASELLKELASPSCKRRRDSVNNLDVF